MRKIMATGTIAGALLLGGVAGSTLLSPTLVNAASPSASPTTAVTTTPATMGGHGPDGPGGNHGFGQNEAVSDTSVVAKAIGITARSSNRVVNSHPAPCAPKRSTGAASNDS